MKNSTLTYLDHLFRDAGWVELRHQNEQGWATSWHATAEELLETARLKAGHGNLFTSLNHVSACPDGAICNDHVDRHVRLLFDFDPARPSGMPSTEIELQAACQRATEVQRHLSGHGWPVPAVAVSGNGYHLQYRTALPNTPVVREQLSVIYAGLHRLFDDDVVSFDRSVRNPGRICTLYGSYKRKGKATAERPHRKSSIVIPRDWRQVRPRQIDQLANLYAKIATDSRVEEGTGGLGASFRPGQGDYRTLDVVAFFKAHGAYVRHLGGNVHGVRCPWSHEHSSPSPRDGSDTVTFEPDGRWAGFACKHAHCSGRNIKDVIAIWPDVDQFCSRAFGRSTGNISSRGVRND